MNSLAKQQKSLSSLFDSMLNRHPFSSKWLGNSLWMNLFEENENTATNIYETDTEYIIEYSKAGIPEEKWDIEIKDNFIFIKADNVIETEEKDEEKKYYKRTYQNIQINENYQIPTNVNKDDIQANYKDGVLKIVLPKNLCEDITEETTKIKVQS